MAVFGFGRRNAVGRQYNGGNVSVMLPRYTTPPERNTRDWLEMFGRNPRLAVVDRIASDLSTCAGKLYRKDENGEEVEITDHPFLNFMAHPNPLYEMTSGACWRLQQIYLELKGEGYFVYEFDALGRPVELWPLPTHWVQQTPYVGYPYYEIRTTGGLIRQIPVDDIFCMKELNPLDPYKRGLGAAESLADEIETDEYAAKFQKKFFYNDATPTTLISMPGSSKDQRDRFRSEWNERFRGPFNSHGIATVDGNVTVTKLAENMRDMDMTEGRRFLRDAVLEHFGVPREIMGITESSNRATSEAAQYIYAQNVIMPRLNRREEAINTQILPFYGNDLVWHFDDVVPRSQEFDKAKGIDGWNAGLLTKDEARELLGMEPCKTGGDCFKITISDMFIGSNDDPAEVTTDLMQESTEEVEVTDDEDTGGMLSMIRKEIAEHGSGGYYGTYFLTLAASGWEQADEESPDYSYIYTAELPDSTSALIPSGAPLLGSFHIAEDAGVVNGCETGDGVVKFYSKEVPAADISTCIILFGKGGGGESDLTVATREQLGHVKIGNGIEVTEDGTISANAKVSEDQIATSDDTSEMLKEIYGE